MNLAAYLLAAGRAEATALVETHETTTYGQLRREAGRIAGGLRAAGAARGDRVLLMAENGHFWVEAYLGALAAGLTCVPLPPKSEEQQVRAVCESAEPRFALMQARQLPRLKGALGVGGARGGEGEVRVFTDEPLPGEIGLAMAVGSMPEAEFAPVEVEEKRDLAGLFFTSGSTGAPRGVMVTHRNVMANTESILGYLPLRAEDRVLQILPMHYCFGTSLVHTHLRAGAGIVIENSFLYPDRAVDRMLREGCTGFAGVPANYQILLRSSRFGRVRLPALRYMLQAGGKLAEEFIDEVRQAQPGARLYVMYGQTEATARLSYLPPELLEIKRGSIGRGIPGVKLRVLTETGELAGVGETGQIVAEGENISPGYWRAAEESAEVFREGQLFTGDMARVDEDGFIYVVGRSRDFLKLGGTRVACQQLERELLQFEGVVDVAAVGVPDSLLGEAAMYFVVHPKGEAARQGLMAFCRENLPPAHWPREVRFLRDLPRTASGKPDRPKLRQMAAGTSEEAGAAVAPAASAGVPVAGEVATNGERAAPGAGASVDGGAATAVA